jgi:proteasome alpha subunit
LANAYSQALSTIFTTQMKPYEVEILIGQVGETPADNELFHILFDGSVADEKGYVAMGGRAEELDDHLREAYRPELGLEEAVRLAQKALSDTEDRTIDAPNLEAAVLDRSRSRRKFRRLDDPELEGFLSVG